MRDDESADGNRGGQRTDNSAYFVIDRPAYNQGANAQYDFLIARGGYFPTLVAKGPHAVGIRAKRGRK